MTQNGPYPGPPWSAGGSSGADEPYTEPADPWSEQGGAPVPPPPHPTPSWGGHPAATAPDSSLGYPTYAQADPLTGAPTNWSQPPAPPPKRNTPIIALVIVLGLLICGGLGTTGWLLANRQDPVAKPTTPPTATVATTEPDLQSPGSENARFVKKGECVRNEGSSDNPDMKIVPCASGTYEVLKRVDGRTTGEADAESKCSKVANYTKWYFYDSQWDNLDFVLCLRERDN
jgi:hypothetical protein